MKNKIGLDFGTQQVQEITDMDMECTLFLSICKQNLFFWQIFSNNLKYEVSKKLIF